MKLHIIIPARKEEEIIIHTLTQIERFVTIPHTVIVVNDFSDPTDTTADVVKRFGRTHKNIKLVIHNPNNRSGGFARVLARGAVEVKEGCVVFVMADDCDEYATINEMYRLIEEGFDVVCGSRYTKGGKHDGGPLVQGFFSYLVNHTLAPLIGIPTTDITNAFKMYRKACVDKVMKSASGGVEFSMVMVIRAFFSGARITEVPTIWRGREKGLSKFKLIERTPRYVKIYLWALARKLGLCDLRIIPGIGVL